MQFEFESNVELSDPAKRPPVIRDPIPDEVDHVPSSPFELDEDRLLKNLRSTARLRAVFRG